MTGIPNPGDAQTVRCDLGFADRSAASLPAIAAAVGSLRWITVMLQAKACRREPECVPAPQGRWDNIFRE